MAAGKELLKSINTGDIFKAVVTEFAKSQRAELTENISALSQ